MLTELPRRGEIWLVSLGANRAGEPGKTRPAVVMSSDRLGANAPDDLVIVVPISSSRAPSALRVEIGTEAGLERPSRIICRAIRAVVLSRFVRRVGHADDATMKQLQDAMALILQLRD